jgi:hypothetical protein
MAHFFCKWWHTIYRKLSNGGVTLTKDIIPEFKSDYSQERTPYSAVVREKYIDKGNLTSRECGRLVKDMIDEYERKLMY